MWWTFDDLSLCDSIIQRATSICVVQIEHPGPWLWGHWVRDVWPQLNQPAEAWGLPMHQSFPKPWAGVNGTASPGLTLWTRHRSESAAFRMVCRFRGRRGESLGDIEIWGPKLHTLRREDDSWLSRCRANPTRDTRSSPSAKFLPAQGRNRAGRCRLVSLLPCSSQYLKFTLRYPCDRMNVASKTNKQAQAKAGLFKLLFFL